MMRISRTRSTGQQEARGRIPGQQSRVLALDGEDGLAKQLDQLTVVTLDRMDGQKDGEVWELEHLHGFREASQCWEMRRETEEEMFLTMEPVGLQHPESI